MWKMKKNRIGLLVGINQGNIVSCHGNQTESIAKWRMKKYSLPFCKENAGVIKAENKNHKSEICAHLDGATKAEHVMEIHSESQLFEIARQINTGDPFYCNGNYKLLSDLDLKKKRWIPMGISQQICFGGTFDGNGYAIKNVWIKGRKKDCIGFFGYTKHATIYNLSIEGKVKGGKYTGAIAGINEQSIISYCFASVKLSGSYCAGGLVGKNTGELLHCYYSGMVSP